MKRDAHWQRESCGAALLCALLTGCGGTPTADPPDFLPTPQGIGVGNEIVTSAGAEVFGPIPVAGASGSVDPDAEVWIVNLDRSDAEPVIVKPASNGSFSAEVEGEVGDRFRLLSRTSERHSLPVDLAAVRGLGMTSLSPLQARELACLKITPTPELNLGTGTARKGSYRLKNECTETVRITRSTLRFGDNGLSFAGPTLVAAGTEGALAFELEGTLAEELWDIVLLDVATATTTGRYALSVWAR